MNRIKFFVVGMLCASTTMVSGQLKKLGDITYFQLPTKGAIYEKVDAYVTLDQSKDRETLGKFGALGNAAASMLKDITEVYDTWELCPPYIKGVKGKGTLRLDVTYRPDDLRRPMTAPPVNQQRGGHVVPYKVFASMKLTDPAGKVLMERNYGELNGEMVSPDYVTAADSKEGIGTYEMACIRAAMLKAQAEVFGLYGYGLMTATLDMGPIKEIKASKALGAEVIEIMQNKQGFDLSPVEKDKLKQFVEVIEANINLASPKTKWAAYHNLAVGYAWLQNAEKAKEYLQKEYEESKESIEKVLSFGKPGGAKSYGGKDLDKYASYCSIEEFVKYYPEGAAKNQALLSVIARPLKQFSDFYANNDLLNQAFGIDFFYQFLPFEQFKGSPKSMKGTISMKDKPDVIYTLDFDKAGNVKELVVESKDEQGKPVETKKIQPVFNKEGQYIDITIPGFDRFASGAPRRADLRRMSAPVNDLTSGNAGKILKGDGLLFETNEKIQMEFTKDGVMYFTGTNRYSTPNAFYSKFLGSGMKYGGAESKTTFNAETQIDANGNITSWKWDGEAFMGWGITLAGNQGAPTYKSTVNGNLKRAFTVKEMNENGLPKTMTVSSEVKATMKTKEIDWKKIKDQYQSYNSFWASAGKPKVNATANGFDGTSTEEWPCEYTMDDKGNWSEAKIGPYTIKREFKY